MPAFSGLWDGEHGETYAATPKAGRPPMLRGIVRTFMQRQSMHGVVEGLGRNAPASRLLVNADRGDITVPGTFTYSTRSLARDVTISNIEPGYSAETRARPTNVAAGDLAEAFDTTRRNVHPADGAEIGVTSPAVAASVET